MTGENTYVGALRAPFAGSPNCVFVFVFISIYVYYELEMNKLQMRRRHLRDLDRPRYELEISALCTHVQS